MTYFGLITEQSRKARAARNLYEHLRQKVDKSSWEPSIQMDVWQGQDGIPVPAGDRARVVNLRFLDEHLSPYLKTNLNLFQMHMIDDSVDVTVYRSGQGWLFVFANVASAPQPFGQAGFDTR